MALGFDTNHTFINCNTLDSEANLSGKDDNLVVIMSSIKQTTGQKRRINYTYRTSTSLVIYCLFQLIALSAVHRANSSGVIELELVDLLRLDTTTSSSKSLSTSGSSSLIRLSVCLKEAFASQLDEPCAFGNGSLTLGDEDEFFKQRLSDSSSVVKAVKKSHGDRQTQSRGLRQHEGSHKQQQQNQQHGSQTANIIRIPFTFRWTKSCTIILTVSRQQHLVASEEDREIGSNLTTMAKEPELSSGFNGELSTNRSVANLIEKRASLVQDTFEVVDRHVFTESELIPSLDLSSSKPWTTRSSRALKTSLIYRFRVLCSSNYFGDDCSVFCRPRDDQFGHFKCSQSGQKICLDGWHGQNCDKARCRQGCNRQHGFCDQPDTCQCRPGWSGAHCDECLAYPGCKNGFCLNPWQCICRQNWGGLLCDQDLNYCSSQAPCQNNATCQNVAPGRYKCHCPTGFTGINCQLKLTNLTRRRLDFASLSSLTHISDECSLKPCLNGATCLSIKRQNSSADEQTEINSLDEDQDQHRNQFYRLDTFQCKCLAGFTGEFCQWSELTHTQAQSQLTTNSTQTTHSNDTAIYLLTSTETFSSGSGNTTLVYTDQDNKTIASNTSQQAVPESKSFTNNEQMIMVPTNDANEALMGLQTIQGQQQIDWRHLISGVVIASAAGVFCAVLLLAWCCSLAFRQGQLGFIQMYFVCRQSSSSKLDADTESSLARLRQQRAPQDRHHIEDKRQASVARMAPPSYEESNYNRYNIVSKQSDINDDSQPSNYYSTKGINCDVELSGELLKRPSVEELSLVKKGALGLKLSSMKAKNEIKTTTTAEAKPTITTNTNTNTNYQQRFDYNPPQGLMLSRIESNYFYNLNKR